MMETFIWNVKNRKTNANEVRVHRASYTALAVAQRHPDDGLIELTEALPRL